MYLDLETLRPSATTGTLEFPTLRLNIWLLVLVWAETEVLDSLSGVLWTPEEEGVGTSWGSQSELVESESFTTGSNDTGTSSSGESESSDGDLWGLQQTVVIGDRTNNDNGLSLGLGLFVANKSVDAGEGDWWAVDLGHEETSEDDLVEVGVGSASQESVELDQEGKVRVVALGCLSVASPLVVCLQIDTHCEGL